VLHRDLQCRWVQHRTERRRSEHCFTGRTGGASCNPATNQCCSGQATCRPGPGINNICCSVTGETCTATGTAAVPTAGSCCSGPFNPNGTLCPVAGQPGTGTCCVASGSSVPGSCPGPNIPGPATGTNAACCRQTCSNSLTASNRDNCCALNGQDPAASGGQPCPGGTNQFHPYCCSGACTAGVCAAAP
jgi:hypothetical protein